MNEESVKYETLRRVAKEKGLSIRQLAIKANIVPQSLYAAIHGRVEFWPGWKKRVAEVLDMNVEELFQNEMKGVN